MENRDEEFWSNVRKEAKNQCATYYLRSEIDDFFNKVVGPAFNRLLDSLVDEYTSVTIRGQGFMYYEKYIRESNDFFVARDLGLQVVPLDWKVFNYYVYAMSPPGIRFPTEYPTSFCVFIIKNGEYVFVRDINACTIDDVIRDAKESYDKDRSKIWPLNED